MSDVKPKTEGTQPADHPSTTLSVVQPVVAAPFTCPIAPEWFKHRAQADRAMKRIGVMHRRMRSIDRNSEYLKSLPEAVTELRDLKENLVGPATGRRQVPLSAHIMMMVFFGIALLVVLIDKSGKTIRIDSHGIEIGQNKTEAATK